MQLKELGFMYLIFAYATSAMVYGIDITLEPYVGEIDNIRNQPIGQTVQRADLHSENGSVVDSFIGDIEEGQDCSVDEFGVQTCGESKLGDDFFSISYESVGLVLKMITGTAVFDLMVDFGVSEFWANIMRAPMFVINVRTVFYLVTGR